MSKGWIWCMFVHVVYGVNRTNWMRLHDNATHKTKIKTNITIQTKDVSVLLNDTAIVNKKNNTYHLWKCWLHIVPLTEMHVLSQQALWLVGCIQKTAGKCFRWKPLFPYPKLWRFRRLLPIRIGMSTRQPKGTSWQQTASVSIYRAPTAWCGRRASKKHKK